MILYDIWVIVVKNLCYYLGDIWIFYCMDILDCYYLVDCIVFLIEGRRLYVDEIVGSDFDGDKFFVCWDEDFVLVKGEVLCLYLVVKLKKWINYFLREDFLKYFVRYSNLIVSKFDVFFDRWVDVEGINLI